MKRRNWSSDADENYAPYGVYSYLAAKEKASTEGKARLLDAETSKKWTGYKSKSERLTSTADLMRAKTGSGQFALTTYQIFKPAILTILAIIFLVGPGLGVFMKLTEGLNIWMWIGILFLVILIWRNK